MKRVFSIIFTILFLCAFFAAVYLGWSYIQERSRAEQEKQMALNSANNEANPLEIQRRELKAQLDILKKNPPSENIKLGTVEFVFRTLDKKLIYDEIFPMMTERGMTGTLLLTNTEVPGLWGKISMDQFQEMLDAGWDYCIQNNAGWGWRDIMENTLKRYNIALPDTVYVEKDKYDLKKDDEMEGYQFMIHHGEEASPVVIYHFEKTGLIHLGAKDWNYAGVREEIRDMMSHAGNLVFTVSQKGDDAYKSEGFKDFLDFLEDLTHEEDTYYEEIIYRDQILKVCTPAQAKAYRDDSDATYQTRADEWQRQVDEIQTQLDALAVQISEIYTRWGVSK